MFRTLVAVNLLILSLAAHAADLETILAENSKAHGGEHYPDVQSIRVRLAITEPTFMVDGLYTATREGQMRIDIYAQGQRVFAEGLMPGPDGPCAWEWTPDKSAADAAQCVGETETAALQHGIEMPGSFYTLLDVQERGASVELIGEVETDDGAEWQVRLTLPDGFARDYFVDQETYQFNRARDHRAFHPGVDPTEVNVETRYSEPELIDGVLRPMRQQNVNVETGEWLGTTKVVSVEHNPEIAEAYFNPEFVPESTAVQ